MRCPKCQGLMVEERFADEHAAFYEWKCVNCGFRTSLLKRKEQS